MEWWVRGLIVLATALVANAIWWVVFGRRQRSERKRAAEATKRDQERYEWAETLVEQTLNDIKAEVRYEIRVSDWGEDFTGQDNTLPRFRWCVFNADALVAVKLNGTPDTVGWVVPYMLGNEHTISAAYMAAIAWVMTQKEEALKDGIVVNPVDTPPGEQR